MTLAGYLSRIEQGLPINFEAFLKRLPKEVARRHRQCFDTQAVGKDRWYVRCNDPDVWTHLLEAAEVPFDRTSAAWLGDSHRSQTAVTYLLVYHSMLTDERPDVVYIAPERYLHGFNPKPTALLIENEENFFRFEEMLRVASSFSGGNVTLDNTDVLLGGGNRVTRALCLDWLATYQRVLCAFDYDRGGLSMFRSVSRRLGEKAEFLQPASWDEFQALFKRMPADTDAFRNAIALAEELGFSDLAQTFRKTGRFMEQEVFLESQDE
ncbi:MAG: hypothetical protein WED00_16440 [Aquisalimonadaceae bacterium]